MRYDSLRMKYNISNFHTGDPVEVQLRRKGYVNEAYLIIQNRAATYVYTL